MSETRNFKVHSKLLMDVIKRQAGTLGKAILEGVMNAVDAGATCVRVAIDADTILIIDDGKGFRSKEEITTFFEVFGQPHDESEGKIYGTFRMGRGQLFAFGENVWKTGEFRMDVDIDKNGLDYKLGKLSPKKQGCSIRVNLYDKLSPSDIAETVRDLEKWCKYAPIEVSINDEVVSIDPENEEWDHETDEAHIRIDSTRTLSVYNLGIHVMDLPGHRYGCGGVIVSKSQLMVNFARNDIQSTCPVWKKLKPFIDKQAADRMTKQGKKSLNDSERQRLADKILQGELPFSYSNMDLRLITAVTGRQYSLGKFASCGQWPCYTEAPHNDRLGDTLMRSNRAFVVSENTLHRFGCTSAEQLISKLREWMGNQSQHYFSKPALPYSDLTEGMDLDFEILPNEELTPREKIWLSVIASRAGIIKVDGEKPYYWGRGRRFVIGISKVAEGWTDGKTYTAINRDWLKDRELNIKGVTEVATLIYHEACHNDLSAVEHDHDQDFYERFHEACRDSLHTFVQDTLTYLPTTIKAAGRKITKAQLKALDKIHEIDQAVEGLDNAISKEQQKVAASAAK